MTCPPTPILEVSNLVKRYPMPKGFLRSTPADICAVNGVSLTIQPGETLGLVGESGCGKTTLGQCILRLIEPSKGEIQFNGWDWQALSGIELRRARRNMQVVFQDPFASLNPRMTIGDSIGEAMLVHGLADHRRVATAVGSLLERVGLPPSWADRYPHELSGGQRQRVGIARAVALEPKLIICDEAVSALDVSIQAQILNLLIDLRREMELAYLFIGHNLATVKHISDRIAVMYLGQIVETAPADALFDHPAHPYTQALLSAIPSLSPQRSTLPAPLEGEPPSPIRQPTGCPFHPRCPAAMEICSLTPPTRTDLGKGHSGRCHLLGQIPLNPEWPRRLAVHQQEMTNKRVQGASQAPARALPPSDDALEREKIFERKRLIQKSKRLRRRQSTRIRRILIVGFVSLGIIALWTILNHLVFLPRQLEKQATALRAEIEAFHAIFKRYPRDLNELGWRLHAIFPQGEARDPRGRPWIYRPPEKQDGLYGLQVAESDGIMQGDKTMESP